MKKLFAVILLGLILTLWLPGCDGPDTDGTVDSTAYFRVAEILRDLKGEQAADEFLATAKPEHVFLIEDTVGIQGHVQILINDSLIFEGPNQMLAGMGQNFAKAMWTGVCGVVSAMTADLYVPEPLNRIVTENMSAPARTAGGRGATDDLTVQSTWTNTLGSSTWLYSNTLYVGTKSIAYQDGGQTEIPNGDVLTVNWLLDIPKSLCAYENAIRFNMAQGINPEPAWGGAMHTLTQARWVFAVGNSGLLPAYDHTGGDGTTQELFIEYRYVSDGAHEVNEFEVYNSNGDLACEHTGYGIEIVANDIMHGFHHVTFQGQ